MKFDFKKLIFPSVFSFILWCIFFFTRMGEPYYALESFWLVGIFMLLLALLFWISNEGVFYSISWGFGKLIDLFRVTPKQTLKYIEYVEVKQGKPKITIWPTLAIGLLLFMVGLIWWLIIQ